MRVLHVVDHLGLGGAPLVVKGLVEGLASAPDLKLEVCALRPSPRPVPLSAPVTTLRCRRLDPLVWRRLERLVRRLRVDLIHAHLEKAVVSSLLAGPHCRCPVVVHEHGAVLRGGSGCVYRALLRLLGRRAAGAIASSAATRDALLATGGVAGGRVLVVPSLLGLPQRAAVTDLRAAARRHLGVVDGEAAVGFVGRLHRAKGVDRLVEAALLLRRRGVVARVFLVGDGPERARLERLATALGLAGTVVFLGPRERPEEVMAAFDVGVVPSRREGFGRSAAELMGVGVPVVATAVGALPELVDHGRTGLLVRDPVAEGIADAVERLLGDPTVRRVVADGARARVEALDGAAALGRVGALYRRLAGDGRPAP